MFDIGARFEIELEGRGRIRLGPADHVASGGEGHVYRKGGTIAIKIWDDPARAVQGRMVEKIRLLSALRHPSLVVPQTLARDARGEVVGYAMPWVDGWALPAAFTNGWRTSHGFGDPDAIRFAARMREAALFVHSRGVVMGDANELNILGVGPKGDCEPRYIDADPWVMPGYPGDKILPTVRDWHSASFSREADWFAWATVSFQLLTGIHPYKGTHPDFRRGDLDARMRANASVFRAEVRTPPSVRGTGMIPAPLLSWYKAVFEKGLRDVPPDPLADPSSVVAGAPMPHLRMPKDAKLSLQEMFRLPVGPVREACPDVLLLGDGRLVLLPDGRQAGVAGDLDPSNRYVRLRDGSVLEASMRRGRLVFRTLRGLSRAGDPPEEAGLSGRAVWTSDDRLFAVTDSGLVEMKRRELSGRTALLPGRTWNINANATEFGDGMAIQDVLGAKFVIAPFNGDAVAMVRTRELDGLKPVAMVRRGRIGVTSLIARDGSYRRAVIVFSEGFDSCDVQVSEADDGSLNEAVTPSGVIVRIAPDGRLELSAPLTGAARVADPGEAAGGHLVAGPSGVFSILPGRVLKVGLS